MFVGDNRYSETFFFFSSRRRYTRLTCDWSSDVCSSDLATYPAAGVFVGEMRSGADRHATTLTLRAEGDSLAGTIEFTVPAAAGTVTGRQAGDTLWLTIP